MEADSGGGSEGRRVSAAGVGGGMAETAHADGEPKPPATSMALPAICDPIDNVLSSTMKKERCGNMG